MFFIIFCFQFYDFIAHTRVGVVQTEREENVLFQCLNKNVCVYIKMVKVHASHSHTTDICKITCRLCDKLRIYSFIID